MLEIIHLVFLLHFMINVEQKEYFYIEKNVLKKKLFKNMNSKVVLILNEFQGDKLKVRCCLKYSDTICF